MGELADMMISGESCELCGMIFKEEQGHPAVCKDCWSDLSKEDRKHHVRANSDTI